MAAYTTPGQVGPPLSIVSDSWQGLQRLATIHLDFSLPGKCVNKLCLKVCIMHSSFTEFASIAVVFPIVMPVSPTVCTEAKNIHLVTDMEGKKQDQHAGGGIAAVVLCPSVMDVFKEGWIIDLNLVLVDPQECLHRSVCEADLPSGEGAGDPQEI